MSAPEVRRVSGWNGRRVFVDVPFRIHGGDPTWIPPLRITVYDRISSKHPANAHQKTALWVAYREGRPVGRIAACVDSLFNEYQKVKWAWVGFYDTFDDPVTASALFDTACSWAAQQGAETCVGPANFTTNDELGLLVEGFEEPPTILTLQNPRYYERLWTANGWEPAMDLWGWKFEKPSTQLSERQRRTLERLQTRAKVRARTIDMDDFDAEVGRFFDVYNAAWQDNWGFAPMPEAEVRHLAKQLKQIIRPEWAFGLETADGTPVAVCLALPDMNIPMQRVRSGRLFPTGWYPLLTEGKKVKRARVWALGVRPDYQHLALGPLLYREIVDRLAADPYIEEAEGGWTLSTNHRINGQLEAMGAVRSKVWRLYQRGLA
ncbi:MAG TPA: GNAT family N-acetyltransferase [Acidimicrobiales bacterium]|nr:GNAT family N-acetyltransferase [Acidimicrobiales bacterium]